MRWKLRFRKMRYFFPKKHYTIRPERNDGRLVTIFNHAAIEPGADGAGECNDGPLVTIFNYHASSGILFVNNFQLFYTANNTGGTEL